MSLPVAGAGGCTELSASPPSQESLRRLPWCTCVSASARQSRAQCCARELCCKILFFNTPARPPPRGGSAPHSPRDQNGTALGSLPKILYHQNSRKIFYKETPSHDTRHAGLARTGTNTGTPREPPKRLPRGRRGLETRTQRTLSHDKRSHDSDCGDYMIRT